MSDNLNSRKLHSENIPDGKVVFLFTDIEGSTKLAGKFPEKLEEILKRHNEILAGEVKKFRGHVFKTIGDAFCTSFSNASDAVRASVEIQRKLNSEAWSVRDIKVRMGIHSGEACWTGEDYSGYLTLSTVQRIMSSAGGGQILVSENVREQMTDRSDEEVSFRNLGERRLKDIIKPVILYQITAPEIPSDFPPLKTLDARQNNLPVQLTTFIGRKKEINEIRAHLTERRLITLTGPGGTGKTRLSLKIGTDVIDEFANGVWFAELASLSETTFIVQEIASVFKVSYESNKDIKEVLKEHLKNKQLLLILDNCEHLISGCAEICGELLAACPDLKIIATSREALQIRGEMVYSIPSLSVPEVNKKVDSESVKNYESIRLFSDRAKLINKDFEINENNASDLAWLCLRLDGIPLAIELAAARINVLPVNKILHKLSNRFSLLTGGMRNSLPRQQTLKALIDWSYELLNDAEKNLFLKISVFSGGCTLEAAEEICSDDEYPPESILDTITSLVSKSLLTFNRNGNESRYNMLESIKHYGCDKSENKSEISGKISEYYYNLSELFEKNFKSTNEKELLNKIENELDNIRFSLNYLLENNTEKSLRMSLLLSDFWKNKGLNSEGMKHILKCLENSEIVDEDLRFNGYHNACQLMLSTGNFKKIKEICLMNIDLSRYNESVNVRFKRLLADVECYQGNFQNAEKLYLECLTVLERNNDKRNIAACRMNLGAVYTNTGKYIEAKKIYEEVMNLPDDLNNKFLKANIIMNLGVIEFELCNYENASNLLQDCLTLSDEMGNNSMVSYTYYNLALVELATGKYSEAKNYAELSLNIALESEDKRTYANSLQILGDIYVKMKDYTNALLSFEKSIVASQEISEKLILACSLTGLSIALLEMGIDISSCILLSCSKKMFEDLGVHLTETDAKRFDENFQILESKLSGKEFTRFTGEGKSIGTDEAILYALKTIRQLDNKSI